MTARKKCIYCFCLYAKKLKFNVEALAFVGSRRHWQFLLALPENWKKKHKNCKTYSFLMLHKCAYKWHIRAQLCLEIILSKLSSKNCNYFWVLQFHLPTKQVQCWWFLPLLQLATLTLMTHECAEEQHFWRAQLTELQNFCCQNTLCRLTLHHDWKKH